MLNPSKFRSILCMLVIVIVINVISSKKSEATTKPKWAKKDIKDFNDADFERLYDQWEEDEEPLPPDELPQHLRPLQKQQHFPFDKVGSMTPDEVMKIGKKSKSVIMFVNLDGSPNRNQCEKLTSLWQTSLSNNHIQVDRVVVEDTQAVFVFDDGSQAWDAKDFLLDQQGLLSITLEGRNYFGRQAHVFEDNSIGNKQEL